MSARFRIRAWSATAINRPTWTCVRASLHASRYASPPIPRTTTVFKAITLTTRASSSSSNNNNNNQHQNPSHENTTNTPPNPTRRRRLLLITSATLLTSYLLLHLTLTSNPSLLSPPPLSPSHFSPFTITALTPLTPTTFLLTLTPSPPSPPLLLPFAPTPPHPHTPPLRRAWHHGLWSVEIKQPQLQVARNYTPLPPLSSADLATGTLRFLIRRVDGGEVSTYLSTLPVGATVELRGPHLGFDVAARLGGEDEVVFLAGGTGVAVAMQVVKALGRLPQGQRPRVEVLWANRERAGCDEAGEMGRVMEGLRGAYGEGRMRWGCRVDEEGGRITSGDVAKAAVGGGSAGGGRWWLGGRGGEEGAAPEVRTDRCVYHDKGLTAASNGEDPFAGEEAAARCLCEDEDGAPVKGGKKLLMVSGPEGFVTAFAGAKVWGEGQELQGNVGGLVGRLKELGGWLILKF